MSEQDKINLLALWLEGQLSQSQQSEFEQLCMQNSDFAERVEQANFTKMMSETATTQEVPGWDRESTFREVASGADTQPRWWHWQGLPIASFACSVCAIVMVSTGFSVQVTEGRMSFGFSQNTITEADVDNLLAAKIESYQQNNQRLFSQYIDAMQSQQLQANTQLTEYLLSSSRQERREDFAELIKFVNEQRRDDQVFYARQINELKQDISTFSPGLSGLYEAELNDPMLDPYATGPDTSINE
jgi:hypothetical protein